MTDTSFLPSLSAFDVQQAAQLIQQAYSQPSPNASPDDLRRIQQELFEIQKRQEAWGLVIPLLEHTDQNVQFFGAHTAQVKIARDWEHFPQEHAESLRDLMVQLTAHASAIGRGKFILRKLFVALTSLALKLVPGHPTRWPEWIVACVTMFSGRGAPTEHIHDFLAIVAEEIPIADLLGPSKSQMMQSMQNAVPIVIQAITSSVTPTSSPNQVQSALRCLEEWISLLPASDITPLIPILIALLNPANEDIFIAASDALQEILCKSALSNGSGSRTLTEPLLLWLERVGTGIANETVSSRDVSGVARSTCKLIVALGDHSTAYLAANIASQAVTAIPVPTTPTNISGQNPPQQQQLQVSKSRLVQTFLRVMLAYTGLPGHYGVDEDESEMTLGFWYFLQEALWSTDYFFGDGDEDGTGDYASATAENAREKAQVEVAKAVYIELVQVLRRKVAFPSAGSGWGKDQVDKFQVYRRDVGDTLINAYYILRDDMLGFYINDLIQLLNARKEGDGWQDIEATLHCIMSIQEAIDMNENTPNLPRLFGPEILGRLPQTGQPRVRRTMLGVIAAYSSWFATLPAPTPSNPSSASHTPSRTPNSATTPLPPLGPSSTLQVPNVSRPPNSQAQALLMATLSYVVSALPNPTLSLQAGTALRNLCDANRKALAPHITAFGQLHEGLGSVPDSEKSKVLQSIASVIQALPSDQEIPPLEAIVNPIVQKLAEALQSAATLPDEARNLAILQLEILSGVSKGLTRSAEGLMEGEMEAAELEVVNTARGDIRMIKLREAMFGVIRNVAEIWSTDVGIGHALSDLFKSITALPNDTTLISLPPGPLLELVCMAVQRQLTAAWISLATILVAQLNPPIFSLTLKAGPTPEAETVVRQALPILLSCGLGTLGAAGAMGANPDIVQEFFVCMDRIAQDFTAQFFQIPEGALDALVQCAISSLSLQERYSLVAASNFLTNLIHRSSLTPELMQFKNALLHKHGRSLMAAVLRGFAGVAPRSVVPNLIEMLGTLLSRAGSRIETNDAGTAGEWMREILFADGFLPSKASSEAKEKFIKGVVGSRSLKKTRDAANQFTLVARGLEGSNFGYTSVLM